MIGFLMYPFQAGLNGLFRVVSAVLGGLFCVVLCGSCRYCRLRDCSCIKRCLRVTGADEFDDFEVVILVHQAYFTSRKQKLLTAVRVTAGDQMVQTDPSKSDIYQQPLAVFVEQGVSVINVELIDVKAKRAVAHLKLETAKDILDGKKAQVEKMFTMKQKGKGVINPRIKLTIHPHSQEDTEQGLLDGVNVSQETDLMLRQQLYKAGAESAASARSSEDRGVMKSAPTSKIDLLTKACIGPLDLFGTFGRCDTVFVAIRGPPEIRKYTLGVWKDQHEFEKGAKANPEVHLMKVLNVQPDPGRPDVFIIDYVDSVRKRNRLTFRRIDRTRDVWVEMLQLLIKMIREAKENHRLSA